MNLDLINFTCQVKNINGLAKVFDKTRNKYVKFTKEEWVRQHVLFILENQLKYPIKVIKTEPLLEKVNSYSNIKKCRSDILVFDSNNHMPKILIECKAPKINISKDHLDQLLAYNHIIQAKFVMLTNGLDKIILKKKNKNIEKIHSLPSYTNLA